MAKGSPDPSRPTRGKASSAVKVDRKYPVCQVALTEGRGRDKNGGMDAYQAWVALLASMAPLTRMVLVGRLAKAVSVPPKGA